MTTLASTPHVSPPRAAARIQPSHDERATLVANCNLGRDIKLRLALRVALELEGLAFNWHDVARRIGRSVDTARRWFTTLATRDLITVKPTVNTLGQQASSVTLNYHAIARLQHCSTNLNPAGEPSQPTPRGCPWQLVMDYEHPHGQNAAASAAPPDLVRPLQRTLNQAPTKEAELRPSSLPQPADARDTDVARIDNAAPGIAPPHSGSSALADPHSLTKRRDSSRSAAQNVGQCSACKTAPRAVLPPLAKPPHTPPGTPGPSSAAQRFTPGSPPPPGSREPEKRAALQKRTPAPSGSSASADRFNRPHRRHEDVALLLHTRAGVPHDDALELVRDVFLLRAEPRAPWEILRDLGLPMHDCAHYEALLKGKRIRSVLQWLISLLEQGQQIHDVVKLTRRTLARSRPADFRTDPEAREAMQRLRRAVSPASAARSAAP